jgi:AhpD family alkylhydroperoxidase
MKQDIFKLLRIKTPHVTGGLIKMRQETFRDAVVPAKYKILAALAVVIVTKCEPCIRGYVKMAFEANVTEEEFIEFLNVAITEAGCPGEQWAMIALGVFKDLQEGGQVEEEVCCKL